jgi:integrase
VERQRKLVEDYAVPETTRATYRSAWNAWGAWCSERGLPLVPVTPDALGAAVSDWSEGFALATIEVRVAACVFHHKLWQASEGIAADRRTDPSVDPRVQVTMKAVRRKLGRKPQRQMAPLSVDDLRKLVSGLSDDLTGIRDHALILIGFAGAMRRSEIACGESAVRANGQHERGLCVEDVSERPEGLRVEIRYSKTDQEGAGQVIGVPRGRDPRLCPVLAYRNWLSWSGITTGPVFRPIDRHGNVGDTMMHSRSVNLRLREACRAAGMADTLVDRIGGHSLRSGFATEAARAGASERSIARTTRHKNLDTLRRYIREGTLFEDNAASRVLG